MEGDAIPAQPQAAAAGRIGGGPGAPVRRRSPFDFARKGAAVVLVLSSLTIGIVGLGLATEATGWGDRVFGIGLVVLTPLGIWLATRVTPEAGTSGYCDKNL